MNLAKLIADLDSSDIFVRSQALESVAELGPEASSAVPKIQEILESEEVETAFLATNALGQIGTPAALRVLEIIGVRFFIDLLNSEGKESKLEAIASLGEIGQLAKKSVPSLVRLLDQKDEEIAILAADALININSSEGLRAVSTFKEKVIPKYRVQLKSKDENKVAFAEFAIEKLEGEGAT